MENNESGFPLRTEVSQNKQGSDGPLKTYTYTSMLNWQALTPEQKEQACKTMVEMAKEEIEFESSDS